MVNAEVLSASEKRVTSDIMVAWQDGELVRIELVKKHKSKKKQHRLKESSAVTSVLEYLNNFPGVKAKKRHQNKYQQNQPDIDMCARVFVPGYMTDKHVLVGGCKADSFDCEIVIAYKFEVKKPGGRMYSNANCGAG